MKDYIFPFFTFILGYFSGVYLPMKWQKEAKTPNISIGPFEDRRNFFSVTNHGGDILNFKIKISWREGKKEETRDMQNFLNVDDDPIMTRTHKLNNLKKNETKLVMHCPKYSDDGIISVFVEGKDVQNKTYKKQFNLANSISPKP